MAAVEPDENPERGFSGAYRERASCDLKNEKFWRKLQETFAETIEMVREDAKARGIDLDAPELQAEVKAQVQKEPRLAAKNRPLARAALAYIKAVDNGSPRRRPRFAPRD